MNNNLLIRIKKDKAAYMINLFFTLVINIIFYIILFVILYKSLPYIKYLLFNKDFSVTGMTSKKIMLGKYILGTVYTAFTSLIFALPVCLGAAVYLSEYAGKKIFLFSKFIIDILAGIPSVVYGVWGILAIVPFIRRYSSVLFGQQTSGYSLISASIVLALMISPILLSVMIESFRTVDKNLKDVSYSLGATKTETIINVVLKKSFTGIITAIIMALSRAFGETLAVMMISGNRASAEYSLFKPVYTLSSFIANNYGEMLSIPGYDSVLMSAALILILIILIVNLIFRIFIKIKAVF